MPVGDTTVVQKVQAARHGQRDLFAFVLPVKLMSSALNVSPKRISQVATLPSKPKFI